MKKGPILGMVLLTASAIIAIIVPSKSSANTELGGAWEGYLAASTDGGGLTCTRAASDDAEKCSLTDESATGDLSMASVCHGLLTESITTFPPDEAE